MTRRNGSSMRERILQACLPAQDDMRELTDTERKLVHGYAKDLGLLLWPEFDEKPRSRRRHAAE